MLAWFVDNAIYQQSLNLCKMAKSVEPFKNIQNEILLDWTH